jgi:CRP-like cAMP-binding protein
MIMRGGHCVTDLPAEGLQFYKLLNFKGKEIIFEQGDPAFGLYYTCSGSVKLWRRTRSGYRQLLALLQGQGYLLGIEALLGDRYDYTAQVVKESQLLFIAREEFPRLPGIELLISAARLVALLERRLADTLGLRAQERLARFLLQQQNSALQRQELASLTGLSFEHTCRLLSKLERRGLIQRNGHTIEVLDAQGLKSLL